MTGQILDIAYLISSLTFIIGLKMLSNPDTARKGNLVAAFGMTLAVIVTVLFYEKTGADGEKTGIKNLGWILGGIAAGTFTGTLIAKRVQMTAMPQMVSLFNGMGGACAAVISIVEFSHIHAQVNSDTLFNGETFTILIGLIIGSVSFAGSMIAYGKLEEKIRDFSLGGQQFINMGLLVGIFSLTVYVLMQGQPNIPLMYLLAFLSVLYGVLFVFPIGGADMPVVISLLNSFTGVAAACGGFLYNNHVMLIGGILVGSAGTILTIVMCRAMNRSLTNVLLGNFGNSKQEAGVAGSFEGSIKEISCSDLAVILKYSRKAVIVPGYGLAVAQAQHTCNELEQLLESEGVEVKYAIHPVAGRMPGHMNVLLAESNVSYDKLVEMEEINPEFPTTDVVLVIGANDVVNPAAHNNPQSPIFGMPILEVENAKNIIVLKRSMKAGYAGIENELFYHAKTRMLFGDAKSSLINLLNEIKNA